MRNALTTFVVLGPEELNQPTYIIKLYMYNGIWNMGLQPIVSSTGLAAPRLHSTVQ